MKTQNTFADGINMDVNPLVAPKTVMSNCLNGTLITYNGNENVLQNDMGNGKVGSAYLPAGWVPVGMAEYGGIIYIAAYNPEEKLSLLGSFPSPQQRFDNTQDGKELPFNLQTGRYRLFTDKDLQLKPGNKLAIYLNGISNENKNNIEPNFNGDLNLHKKHWNVDLSLLTNNGALTNVTEYLETRVPVRVGNEVYVLSDKYFFISNNIDDSTFLLENNLRVYSGTLTGVPYIEVSENLAESMTIELLPGKIKEVINGITPVQYPTFKLNCTIRSSSQLYGYLPSSETLINELGLLGLQFKINAGWIGNDYHAGGYICFDTDAQIEWENKDKTKSLIVTNLVINYEDLNTRDYVVNIQATLKFKLALPSATSTNLNFTIEVCPIFSWDEKINWENLLRQESLILSYTFEANKIGTGLHQINQWRYYYTEDWLTLTWGMESYPSMGENMKDLYILFVDLNGNSIYSELHAHDYYNGEFTDVFDSSMFTTKLPYIAKLSWKVGDKELADYRWIIPTALYNDFYLNKMVLDFNFDPNQELTENLKAMLVLKTINGNILKFAEEPVEELEYTCNINPFFELAPNIDSVNITNTYTYTLNSKLTAQLTNYPFELSYTSPSSITFIHDNNTYLNKISNTLTTEHPVKYNLKNISITKLFVNHQNNILKNTAYYMVVEVYRKREDGLHVDDNYLRLCAWDTTSQQQVIKLTPLKLYNNTNDTVTWDLGEYWNNVQNHLNNLYNRLPLYVIPIIFTNRAYLWLNYAVKCSKGNDWRLYWSYARDVTSILSFGFNVTTWIAVDEYKDLSQYADKIEAIVYEAKSEGILGAEHLLGFPYYFAESINGSSVNGYLIDNNTNKFIEEESQEFNFTVETNIIELNLLVNDVSYNNFIQEKLSSYFITLLSRNLKSEELCKEKLQFNTHNTKVICDYVYSNLKPGNLEVRQIINNYNILGISTMVKEASIYIPNEDLSQIFDNILTPVDYTKYYSYKYYIPEEELDGDTVYKLENGKMTEFELATIVNGLFNRHIISAYEYFHDPWLIRSQVGNDWCELEFLNVPSLRGDEVFGKSVFNLDPIETDSPLQDVTYGTAFDIDGDGITDYWIKQDGYYSNGARRLLKGTDTDGDGIPDNWVEFNKPRNSWSIY